MNTGIPHVLPLYGTISASTVFDLYPSDIGCGAGGGPSGTDETRVANANGRGTAKLGPCEVKFETGYFTDYLLPSTRLTASGFGFTDVEANPGISSSATFTIEIETEIVYFHHAAGSITFPVGAFPPLSGELQLGQRAHVFGHRIFPGATFTVSITAGGNTATVSGTVPSGEAGNVFCVRQPNSAFIPYDVTLTASIYASDQFRVWEEVSGACVIALTTTQQTGFCEISATFLGQPVVGNLTTYSQDYSAIFPYTAASTIKFEDGVRVDANGAAAEGVLIWKPTSYYEVRAALRDYSDPYGQTFQASAYEETGPTTTAVRETIEIGDACSPIVEREFGYKQTLFGMPTYGDNPSGEYDYGFSHELEIINFTGPKGMALSLPSQPLPDGDPNSDARMLIRLPKADAIKVKQEEEIILDDATSTTGWTGATLTAPEEE